ncbi:ATP-dependent Clp protease proteolytic subunit, partial [Escherichia coli]|nr:ATP-dependent Clp protease proteolytic subunit [Escherichia coli]
VIESLAASAASFIAVGGGDTVISRPNAEVMIHKAWTMNVGNADDMQRAICDLQRQDVKLAGIYAAKAGGEVDEWLDRMSA